MLKTVAAYITGFFDGDGSVRLQLQPRANASLGFRIRAILSFAQKTGHAGELSWIRNQLGIGYIYARNDGMTELKIEGFERVYKILKQLAPYTRFKKKQVALVLEGLAILRQDPGAILKIARIADQISSFNYATTRKKYTSDFIKQQLEQKLTPVTTDPALSAGEK